MSSVVEGWRMRAVAAAARTATKAAERRAGSDGWRRSRAAMRSSSAKMAGRRAEGRVHEMRDGVDDVRSEMEESSIADTMVMTAQRQAGRQRRRREQQQKEGPPLPVSNVLLSKHASF